MIKDKIIIEFADNGYIITKEPGFEDDSPERIVVKDSSDGPFISCDYLEATLHIDLICAVLEMVGYSWSKHKSHQISINVFPNIESDDYEKEVKEKLSIK